MVVLNFPNNAVMPDTSSDADLPPVILDITAETCPMTFVRTRIALDRLPSGGRLLVLLKGEDPRRSVPATALRLGHSVLSCEDGSDGITRLLLRRK